MTPCIVVGGYQVAAHQTTHHRKPEYHNMKCYSHLGLFNIFVFLCKTVSTTVITCHRMRWKGEHVRLIGRDEGWRIPGSLLEELRQTKILSRVGGFSRLIDGFWIGWLNLLTLYIFNSGLHIITAPSLIYTIYSSPLHTPTLRFSVFTSRILATNFNTVIIPVSL
jgi:hypothetical protein